MEELLFYVNLIKQLVCRECEKEILFYNDGEWYSREHCRNISLDELKEFVLDTTSNAYYNNLCDEGRFLELPCKIGTPVYFAGCIDCKDCVHGKDQTYDMGWYTSEGEPFADDCKEICPEAVRSMPFSLSMLNDDGTLDKYWKLNKEDVKLEDNIK
jgi:hypothetical protein